MSKKTIFRSFLIFPCGLILNAFLNRQQIELIEMLNLNTILHSLSTDEVIQSSVEDTLRKKEFPANKRSTTNIQYVSTANSRTVDHILSRCFRTLHNFNCFRRLCISQQLSNTEMMACPTSPRSTDKRLSPSRAFHTSQVRFASSIRASTRPLSPCFQCLLAGCRAQLSGHCSKDTNDSTRKTRTTSTTSFSSIPSNRFLSSSQIPSLTAKGRKISGGARE